ncbi:hypothetical protein ACWEWI_09040 [Streptomyces sp. NPDC003753]|uniref:hypothetical protein n=1 Tax=unclassified Streptomyces TaxID=2593676 RepID=UPI0019032317|nr:hypothetical protein [Streptomyces sp. Y2F8-2]GHK01461.1 hypothetical protein SY2F82_32580 [Streptomyces sp. Y2F8-2]
MSETTTATSELTSQYAAQVAGDLERNVKEQERISAEITALQEQLATLQHDHAVLVTMQNALGIPTAPVEPVAAPDSATVPAPRKKSPAGSGTGRQPQAKKKAAAGQTRTTGRKTAGKKAAGKKTEATKAETTKTATAKTEATKAGQPTLVELVRAHLSEQSEPRSAAEVADALGKAHPERGIKTTVVRSTLEGLVAKKHAQRTKQGTAVFYTTPDATEPTTASEAEDGAEQDR